MLRFILAACLTLFFISCNPKKPTDQTSTLSTRYAKNFALSEEKAQIWGLGYGFKDTVVVAKPPKPWQRVACLSSTHVSMIEAIGQLHKLKALQYGDYIYSPQVLQKIGSGQIADLGNSEIMSAEPLLSLNIEAVFVFGMNAASFRAFQNWRDVGIVVVPVGEWMEQEPLGRSEWLRFFGYFLEAQAQADSVFEAVRTSYERIKALPCESGLSVISGIGYSGQWSVPGGRSYMAKLFEDACGDYVLKTDTTLGSISMGLEGFLVAGSKAKIWLNPGTFTSRKQILTAEPRLHYLLKNMRVFNCTKRVSPKGGFDFYYSGAWRADLILNDLRQILQGQTLNGYYYEELNPL